MTPVAVLIVTIIGAIAVAVAVFGHPTQAIAAAVIVTALVALVGGPKVLRGAAEAFGPLTRLLPSSRDSNVGYFLDGPDRPPLAKCQGDGDSVENDGLKEELRRRVAGPPS